MKKVNKLPKHLYHLSDTNHNGETFVPRVPDADSRLEDENSNIKRICVSSILSGAFRARFNPHWGRHLLYIHIPVGNKFKNHLYKPSDNEVSDVMDTYEYWIKCKTKFKCIGVAYFYGNKRRNWTGVTIKWIKILKTYENKRRSKKESAKHEGVCCRKIRRNSKETV